MVIKWLCYIGSLNVVGMDKTLLQMTGIGLVAMELGRRGWLRRKLYLR